MENSFTLSRPEKAIPPEGARLKTNELWDLVNYVRSLAKKDPSAIKRHIELLAAATTWVAT